MADQLLNMVIKGMKETQANMTQAIKDLEGPPIVTAMKGAVLIVQRFARKNAPVDRGTLRASILPEVVQRDNEVTGVVGSNRVYAPAQEGGTKPFWPPISALETWARRHGISAFLVARAISRRGIKALHFLQNAFEDNKERIIAKFDGAVKGIVREAND